MKSYILVILIFLSILFPELSNAQDTPIRIACIGNSITEGSGLVAALESYPAQLQALLGDKYNVKNCGVSGRTMLKKGDFPLWKEKKFADALSFKPHIVTIMLGTNDSKFYNWAYKSEFYADYISMVDTFAHLETKPEIWLCRPLKVFKGLYDISDSVIYNEVIPIINQVAKDKNLKIIDFYEPMLDKPQLLYDGIHPSAEGSYFVAKIFYEELTNSMIKSFADENLVLRKSTLSSGYIKDDKQNYTADMAVDADLNSKWSVKEIPAWMTVDLGSGQKIDNFQLFFLDEKNKGFQYTIEGSDDGTKWNKLVDQSKRNDTIMAYTNDNIAVASMRYIKLTITGLLYGNDKTVNLFGFKAFQYTGYGHAPILYSGLNSSGMTRLYIKPSSPSSSMSIFAYNKTNDLYKWTSLIHDMNKESSLGVQGNPNSVYAYYSSSFYNGIEVISDTVHLVFKEPVEIPNSISPSLQNTEQVKFFPNPFVNEITISNLLKHRNQLSVKIFDMNGRLVKILSNSNSGSGKQQLAWNGTNMNGNKVPAGLYLCRLESNQSIQYQKIILMGK